MNEAAQHYEATATHPGFGPLPLPGRLFLDHFHLRFESEPATFEIPYEELKLHLEEGDEPALIFEHTKGSGWVIRTLDFDVTKNHAFTKNHLRLQWKQLAGQKTLHRALIASVAFIVCFLLIGLAISWMGGKMVRHAVNQISPEKEKKLGDEVYAEYKRRLPGWDDPAAMARVQAAYRALQKGLPNTNLIIEFHIIDQQLPNAGSLPGHIFINRGLFDLISTPEDLAGVLAHELGHIHQKHAFRLIVAQAGPAFVLKTYFGKSDSLLTGIVQNSQLAVGRTFSQEYEREADDEGWKYLVAANINPHGLIDMLEKFQNLEENLHIERGTFASHPATIDRIKRLEARWDKMPVKTNFVEFPVVQPAPP